MRKFYMLAAAALAAALWLPAAAQAQGNHYSYPKTEYGNWKVYGLDRNCWFSHRLAVDGTLLSFAISAGRQDFYFGFENRSWSQIEHMRRYDVTLRFGDTENKVTATGMVDERLGPMMVVFTGRPTVDLFPMLRGSRWAGVELQGTTLFDVPLDPSAAAIDDFEACARQFKAGPYSGAE